MSWWLGSRLMFAAIFALAVALHLRGRRHPQGRVPSVGVGLGWAMVTPIGRVTTLLFWGWVGLHFFARSGP